MNITVIIMLAIGAAVAVAGFVLPENKGIKEDSRREEEKFRKYVEEQLREARRQIEEAAEETTQNASEKMERALERISNEKIAALGDYSDSVLHEIHNNHEEVMFLYDMLNDKQDLLKNTAVEVTNLAKVAEEKARDAKLTAEHMAETVQRAARTVAAIQNAAATLETLQKLQPFSVAALVQDEEKEGPADGSGLPGVGSGAAFETAGETGIRKAAGQASSAEEGPVPGGREPDTGAEETTGLTEEKWEEWWEKNSQKENAEAESTEAISSNEMNEETLTEAASTTISAAQTPPEGVKKAPAGVRKTVRKTKTAAGKEETQPEAPAQAEKKGAVRKTKQEKAKQPAAEASNKAGNTQSPDSVQIQFVAENGPIQNNNARILELHRSGRSNMSIARELGLGIGEVKLVIDLFEGM